MIAARTTNGRLPGIYFRSSPLPAGPGLPPLDVAAFLGFAERGPLDVPVAVEDVNTYQAVFGGDLPLAQEEGGLIRFANLPGSVGAFFANGGRRCYVVRVAGKNATAARFRVPSLVGLTADGRVQVQSIRASSPGRWANSLSMTTRLQTTPLPPRAFSIEDPDGLYWCPNGAGQSVQTGDVLRVTLPDAHNAARQTWLVAIGDTRPASTPSCPTRVKLSHSGMWQVLTGTSISPPPSVQWAFRLNLDGAVPLQIGHPPVTVDLRLDLPSVGDGMTVQPGDVLLLGLSDGNSYLFPVESIEQVQSTASPPAAIREARATSMLCISSPAVPLGSPPVSPHGVDLLRFDLLLRDADKRRPAIASLAFNANHPRFWGDVVLAESGSIPPRASADQSSGTPTAGVTAQTAELFRDMQNDVRSQGNADETLDASVAAALLAPIGDARLTYLPLDMLEIVTDGDFAGPAAGDGGSDDLDAFDGETASLFLDPYLVPAPQAPPASARSLTAASLDRYYVQNRRLRGVHSLTFVDEVALVAAPDAVHPNWHPAETAPLPVPPTPAAPPAPKSCPPDGPFVSCTQPPVVERLLPTSGPASGGTPVTITGSGFAPGPATTVTFDGAPAGDVRVTSDSTLTCTTPVADLAVPVTVAVATPNGSGSKERAFTYVIAATQPALPVMDQASAFDLTDSPLVAIQQGLITFCGARADVVAILTLPQHFEKQECLAWQQYVRGRLGLPLWSGVFSDTRDIADLSYAALYHPWLLVPDASAPDGTRAISCEGAVCGTIGARERDRQVWVAPANIPLQGVVGVTPAISGQDAVDLFARQLNLIRAEANDFRSASAHTMSDERSLLQLSVRRLMILLRKMAAERGMDYVFETNHERFREGVRVVLEGLLRSMFQRGAFAGPSPQSAFRVVTDSTVNPPESIDAGRFIAQIQVAPSQPLEFISVLLTRTGDGLMQLRET